VCVQGIAAKLKAEGFSAAAYHADLSDSLRKEVQINWEKGVISIVVATIAFGMGVDKADGNSLSCSLLLFDFPFLPPSTVCGALGSSCLHGKFLSRIGSRTFKFSEDLILYQGELGETEILLKA
jgi:hypothetical protein